MSVRSIWAAACVVWLAGCGYSPEDYCTDYCDCEGCSDNEYDDCVDTGEDLYKDAEDEGCADQADEYLSCLGDEVECNGGDFDADGCEREYVDALECTYGRQGGGID